MRFLFSQLLLAGVLCAQIQIQAGNPQVLPPTKLPSDKVVARVQGEKITVKKLRDLLTGAPTPALQQAATNPQEFLTWTSLMDKLRVEAEKIGLDRKPPYKDRLEWNYGQVLAMARLEAKGRETQPSDEEARQWYGEILHLQGTAKVKLIFAAAEDGKEGEAKARERIDGLVKQLRAGADFAALAKKHSDDSESAAKGGDFPDVGPDSKLPEPIRKAIFRAKPGALTEVIQQPAGFYVFKVVSIDTKPFDQNKSAVKEQFKQKKMEEWMAEQRTKVVVENLNEAFFRGLPITTAGMKVDGLQEIKESTPLAKINGKVMVAEEFTNLMKAVPPEVRQKAIFRPIDFLAQYALTQLLTRQAEELGVDKQQPYAGRIRYNRNEMLMQAFVDRYMDELVVSAEDQRKGYDGNPERFEYANIKVIYVSYSVSPPPQADPKAPKILNEDEARSKADDIMKQLRGGSDFVAMVSRYSEDEKSKAQNGDGPVITSVDGRVPDEIRLPVMAAKEGDLLGPMKLANGFYILKVVERKRKSYEEVKNAVYDEIRQARFQQWFDEQRKSIQVDIDDPSAFRIVAAEFQ